MRPVSRYAAAALAAFAISQLAWLPAWAAPATARAAPATAGPTAPAGVIADASDLVNARTGARLWSRDLNAERPIASITKVMTALVVIDAGTLTRKIRVTRAAEEYGRAYGPSEAGLHPGDILTTRQLLEAMLLPSASDAAYLLARTYGPGWPAFVRKMNATARRLGMTRTHFANFDGLPWPTEYSTYSTPRDLIRLGTAAMKLPAFRQIVAQRSHLIRAAASHHRYFWRNTDLLLGSYRGAIGIKTGFTNGAGYCLLFEARRGRTDLMGVVLGSTGTEPGIRFTAAARLLNWGFAASG